MWSDYHVKVWVCGFTVKKKKKRLFSCGYVLNKNQAYFSVQHWSNILFAAWQDAREIVWAWKMCRLIGTFLLFAFPLCMYCDIFVTGCMAKIQHITVCSFRLRIHWRFSFDVSFCFVMTVIFFFLFSHSQVQFFSVN